jgi:mevalonate kinase
MPAISSSAPGKIILFGEHAVVYGRPAIAVPVEQVRAKAIVTANPNRAPGSVVIQAPNIKIEEMLADLPVDDPLGAVVRSVFKTLGISRPPALTVRISATIPIAAGLGSGAAVSVAIIRALSAFLGQSLTNEQVSALAYEIEKLHHGTPSGIDNTVITYQQPIYFQRINQDCINIERMSLLQPFTIIIADTGVPSPTSVTVGDVRRAWFERPKHFERIFDNVADIVEQARQEIQSGQVDKLGELMNTNQQLLRELGVSSPELENLVQTSLGAGAQGAKLSGGGRGGNVIALTTVEHAPSIAQSLQYAGATRVITTLVKESSPCTP